jgi:hypothetical protein
MAYFVDQILKGARPADLPVEQASKLQCKRPIEGCLSRCQGPDWFNTAGCGEPGSLKPEWRRRARSLTATELLRETSCTSLLRGQSNHGGSEGRAVAGGTEENSRQLSDRRY